MQNQQFQQAQNQGTFSNLGKRAFNQFDQSQQQVQDPQIEFEKQKQLKWQLKGKSFVDHIKTLDIPVLTLNQAYEKVRDVISDDPQYFQNCSIENLKNQLIFTHFVNIDEHVIEQAQIDFKKEDNLKYYEIRKKYHGGPDDWSKTSRADLVTLNRGKQDQARQDLANETRVLDVVEDRIMNRPPNDIRRRCNIPSGNCIRLRNTFVEPCHCLIVCHYHAQALTQIFNPMLCPRCQNPITNHFTVIDGGFQ